MKQVTTEIRWFDNALAVEAWWSWFIAPCHRFPLEPPRKRTDCYLGPFLERDIGVKIRGRDRVMEIKTCEDFRAGRLAQPPFNGSLARWSKWQFTAPRTFTGVPVQKYRMRRMFRCDDNGDLEVALQPRQFNGCMVEVTRAFVAGQAWITLGLEAFGDTLMQSASLQRTATLLRAREPPSAAFKYGMGYPEWLTRLSLRTSPSCSSEALSVRCVRPSPIPGSDASR